MKMYRQALSVILGAGALLAASPPALQAQTVSDQNYRRYAACAEVQIEGRTFNTFGEGRCPPGGRRAQPFSSATLGEANALQLNAADAQVRALQSAQQSVLAMGAAITNAAVRESNEILSSYAFHFPEVVSGELYADQQAMFPLPGEVAVAAPNQAVVVAREVFLAECFVPRETHTVRQWPGHVHTIQGGEPSCKLAARNTAYNPLYLNYSGSAYTYSIGQTLEERRGTYRICYRQMGMNAMCADDIAMSDVERLTGLVERVGTSQDRLIFVGTDSTGRIQLRAATSNDEWAVDPGAQIEFDGLRLEILSASPTALVVRRLN